MKLLFEAKKSSTAGSRQRVSQSFTHSLSCNCIHPQRLNVEYIQSQQLPILTHLIYSHPFPPLSSNFPSLLHFLFFKGLPRILLRRNQKFLLMEVLSKLWEIFLYFNFYGDIYVIFQNIYYKICKNIIYGEYVSPYPVPLAGSSQVSHK